MIATQLIVLDFIGLSLFQFIVFFIFLFAARKVIVETLTSKN